MAVSKRARCVSAYPVSVLGVFSTTTTNQPSPPPGLIQALLDKHSATLIFFFFPLPGFYPSHSLSLSLSPSLSRRSVSSHADRLFEVAPASSPLPFVIVGFGGLDGVMRDTAERLGFLWNTAPTRLSAADSNPALLCEQQVGRQESVSLCKS